MHSVVMGWWKGFCVGLVEPGKHQDHICCSVFSLTSETASGHHGERMIWCGGDDYRLPLVETTSLVAELLICRMELILPASRGLGDGR